MKRTAGLVADLHKVVKDAANKIIKGGDSEAAAMAETWVKRCEETDFAEVNFNKDVYLKLRGTNGIDADISYFTFRNHFIAKVLAPLKQAVRDFLIDRDSSLKSNAEELGWIGGFLDNYVTVSSVDALAEAKKAIECDRALVAYASKKFNR